MALTDKLTAIGDAIRTKTGSAGLLTLDQMATEIANISGGSGGDIDFNIQSIQVANSASTSFTQLTLTPDDNKNNIWIIPLRPSTGTSNAYVRWTGYPGLVIKLLKKAPVLQLFNGSTGNTYSPWYGYNSSIDNQLTINEEGKIVLPVNTKAYPAEHNLMWKITF